MFLWLETAPERLGTSLDTLIDEEHELLLSAVSSWELAIKSSLGRLALPEPTDRYVVSRARDSGIGLIPIDHADAFATAALGLHHRDPFDRMLVAQARRRELTLVTADRQLEAYDVELLLVG